jgi:RNA polymerase sigma factor (TIGR02999 family)
MTESAHPCDPEHLYHELRALADRHMASQRGGHSLQPTALVHEVYLKLAKAADVPTVHRTHFLALASRAMRQVLIDHERLRRSDKRQTPGHRITLTGLEQPSVEREVDLVALQEALAQLAESSPEKMRVVELRFFGGLTESEAAEEMSLSRATVARHWRFVRAFLAQRLTGADSNPP